MKASDLLWSTTRDMPAEAEVISHQLMIRAGFIKKVASGIYNWLPMGLIVLDKIQAIIHEEMAGICFNRVAMPMVQPMDLWESSGRANDYGPELLTFTDRHDRAFCLGPTHEEVVTNLIQQQLNSYKQLPICVYQIQQKFRDEIRPRFGVMRGREFLMKDGYSFHLTHDSLDETYDKVMAAYKRIFSRIGLDYRAVVADNGSIGGSASHEFHVLADSGEDDIAFSSDSDYAANVEVPELQGKSAGDPSPCGQGVLQIKKGIEVGHIFKLGKKYSEAMGLSVANKDGEQVYPDMGCYGIGVSRIVAAAIEQSHDDEGIIWPINIAPFQIVIIALQYEKSDSVKQAADDCYQKLIHQGYEVLLDDRPERPGAKFADMDLVGIPVQMIIGDRSLGNCEVEVNLRAQKTRKFVPLDAAEGFIASFFNEQKIH